jgi:transposase
MLDIHTKAHIINLKRQGKSLRYVANKLNINRETVAKYWNETRQKLSDLELKGEDARTIQNEIYSPPTYKPRDRAKRKVTEELLDKLQQIVNLDRKKCDKLGWKKQHLTNVQIHKMLLDEGYEISLASLNLALAKIRKPDKPKTAYIKQKYDYGKRLEFDFGEVKLDLGSGLKNYHLAVFCAPASNFRWCFLYDNQKKSVFLDSHVQFFDLVGGVYQEVVYDNMKNVVAKFEGKTDKKINEELLKLAAYYGFEVKTTNPYAGNEKGSVERSVEFLRTRLFAVNQRFNSIDAVRKYMKAELTKLNINSGIDMEREYLKPAPTPFELAEFCECSVSKYGFISVDGNRYSVPEEYVGERVLVKKYHDEIRISFDLVEIARHKRNYGKGKDIVEINHFLNTFNKKPGSIENSIALRSIPQLKKVFDEHFKNNPRVFIDILFANPSKNADELVKILLSKVETKIEKKALKVIKAETPIENKAKTSLAMYGKLKEDVGYDD